MSEVPGEVLIHYPKLNMAGDEMVRIDQGMRLFVPQCQEYWKVWLWHSEDQISRTNPTCLICIALGPKKFP